MLVAHRHVQGGRCVAVVSVCDGESAVHLVIVELHAPYRTPKAFLYVKGHPFLGGIQLIAIGVLRLEEGQV